MTHQTDTPIVQKTYDFYKLYYTYIDHLPHKMRKVLGRKIEQLILEVLENIANARFLSAVKKLPQLEQASMKLDTLKMFIRLCHELKAINQNKYIMLETPLQEIGYMLGGWIRSLKNTNPEQ